MEVCGTHTMAISSSGIRKAVDQRLKLVSGPGCPVCVTTPKEIDQALALTRIPDTVVLTFGDMMRVPGSDGSLLEAKARGADVRVVYSPRDGLMMAQAEPQKSFVLIGVGFETTAPTVAATVIEARARRIKNFSVLPLFKLIPPALDFIASSPKINIDGFILPGHVSTVIGTQPYEFLVNRYCIPCCITGFDPVDILSGVLILLHQIESETPAVANEYRRSVRQEGNLQAKGLMKRVFRKVTAEWRGIGPVKNSGLEFKQSFIQFDARWRLKSRIQNPKSKTQSHKSACRCGEVMLGLIVPSDCPLFARVCTPGKPVGPCMVSSEGACAAYYKYER